MQRINFSLPWPFNAVDTRETLSFAFQTAIVSYLGFYLLNSIYPGFVTNFYSLDPFLWAAIITGVISTIWPVFVPSAKKITAQPTWIDFLWMGVLTITTVIIVWTKVATIDWPAIIIAPLSGLIVLGLSLLVYYDRDDDPESNE